MHITRRYIILLLLFLNVHQWTYRREGSSGRVYIISLIINEQRNITTGIE